VLSPCRDHCWLPRRQRGATLVLALVVVLLVTAVVTRMGSEWLLLLRTVAQQDEVLQARSALQGAESLAREALLQDLQYSDGIDSPLELWSGLRELALPGAVLRACLSDLQGRLNLNDLGAVDVTYSTAQRRFIRLLQVLPMADPPTLQQARELAHAVFDWVDVDNQTRMPGGAEAAEYQRLDPPYRPANQPFVSISELQLVHGMTPQLVAALTPFVAVWGNASLNFNSMDPGLAWSAQPGMATAHPVLLRTLNHADTLAPLSLEAARRLAALRSSSGGFVASLDFFRQGEWAQQNWDLEGLALASDFFKLTAVYEVDARHYRLETVLERSMGGGSVPRIILHTRTYQRHALHPETDCAVALP
jgi:general secretion pathway protein K